MSTETSQAVTPKSYAFAVGEHRLSVTLTHGAATATVEIDGRELPGCTARTTGAALRFAVDQHLADTVRNQAYTAFENLNLGVVARVHVGEAPQFQAVVLHLREDPTAPDRWEELYAVVSWRTDMVRQYQGASLFRDLDEALQEIADRLGPFASGAVHWNRNHKAVGRVVWLEARRVQARLAQEAWGRRRLREIAEADAAGDTELMAALAAAEGATLVRLPE